MKPKLLVLALACGLLLSVGGGIAMAGHHNSCCCPPPPVKITFCAVDPCTCCKYTVDVCIPACCAEEVPCVSWRNGIFGRRVATYYYKCCGYSFDIVVNHKGRYWVR